MLEYAEKYNWWTPQQQKKNLSLESKIEYLLERGTLDELKQAVKEVGGSKIFNIWKNNIKNKGRHLKDRNLVIKFFVTFHKSDFSK
jgi:hypothetical protein